MFDIAALNHTRMAAYKKMRATTTTVPASSAEKTNTSAAASATASSNLNSTQGAVAFHDTLTRFILPLCSAMSDRENKRTVPVSSAVYLVDVSSFGLKQALELRNYAQDISKLLATCYPEVVDTVFVSCDFPPPPSHGPHHWRSPNQSNQNRLLMRKNSLLMCVYY